MFQSYQNKIINVAMCTMLNKSINVNHNIKSAFNKIFSTTGVKRYNIWHSSNCFLQCKLRRVKLIINIKNHNKSTPTILRNNTKIRSQSVCYCGKKSLLFQ